MTNKEFIEVLTKNISTYGEIPCFIEIDSSYDNGEKDVKDCLYDNSSVTIYNF